MATALDDLRAQLDDVESEIAYLRRLQRDEPSRWSVTREASLSALLDRAEDLDHEIGESHDPVDPDRFEGVEPYDLAGDR